MDRSADVQERIRISRMTRNANKKSSRYLLQKQPLAKERCRLRSTQMQMEMEIVQHDEDARLLVPSHTARTPSFVGGARFPAAPSFRS